MEVNLKRGRKPIEPPLTLVPLTIRVHPEARRQLKSVAALDDMSMEEKARTILYQELRLEQLPITVEPPVRAN